MQQEIIDLLLKEKKPLSRKEIATKLNTRDVKISDRLNRLIKHKEILTIEVNKDEALIKYGSKRRLRLYYVQ